MSELTRDQILAAIEGVDEAILAERTRHEVELGVLCRSRNSLTGQLRSTDAERTSYPFVPRDAPRDGQDRPKPALGAQSVSDVIGAEYLAWYAEQGLLWLWRTADGVGTRHLIVEPAEPHELKLRCSTRLPGLDTGLLSRQTSLGPTTSSMVMCRECAGLINTQLSAQARPLRRPATTDVPVRKPWREVLNLLDGERLLWVKHQELPRVLHVEQDMLARSEAIEDATDCGLADHHDGREYPVLLSDQRITPIGEGTYPQRLDELVYVCARCLARLHDAQYA